MNGVIRDALDTEVQARPPVQAPSGLHGWFANRSIRLKLNAIAGVYVAIILAMLAVVTFTININNGVRAYVQGEGLWSKGQKDAVYYLARYARYKEDADYQKYLQAIAIPLGDRRAREELQKPQFDYAVVEQGFVAGANAIEDVPYLVSLFRNFHGVSYLADAIRMWTEADVQIEQLVMTAQAIRAAVGSGQLTPESEARFNARIEQINAQVTPIEKEFSKTLGVAARWIRGLLLSLIIVCAGILLAAGLSVSTWISRQLRARLTSLREGAQRVAAGDLSLQIPIHSRDEIGVLTHGFNDMIMRRRRVEDRLHHTLSVLTATLESTADGILVVDLDGRIVCYNRRFIELWRIPESLMQTLDGRQVQQEASKNFDNPDEFLRRNEALFAAPEQDSFELLELKDGRIFERNSRPQRVDGKVIGRVCSFRDVTERKRAEAHIHQLAHHDALTRLPNRTLLLDRLEKALQHAQRSQTLVAVMMIDLDHFKHVNDSLGHAIGDQLLVEMASRLVGCVRKVDTVARMGGDEFIVMLTEAQDRGAVERVARLILDRLSAPIILGSHELVMTPSIGLCVFPDDGDSAMQLIKAADTAMYQAKAQGRGRFYWFAPRMMLAADERLALETDLRRALEHDEFSLHYQPLVSVQSGHVIGCEALLRWTHPRRGTVLPASFVPLAEETGLIVPIGEWALRQACVDAQKLQNELGMSLFMSVNISTRQFRQDNLLRVVEDALIRSNLPPRALVLEITEGVLAANPHETAALLRQIRELGVRIAVDDFGTGYSSLSYITRYPIDMLKIDSSFVRDLAEDKNDAAITSAIIALAHSLNLDVIAEGVETRQQLAFLQERVCNEAQGYFFGRPVPAVEFAELAGRINTASVANSVRH